MTGEGATPPGRIVRPQDLGRAHRSLDVALGVSAAIPLVLAAVAVWFAPPREAVLVRLLAVVWTASLLTFFAGVRRGLSFSEAGGARPAEVATLLGLFSLGVVTLVAGSPVVGAFGLAILGVLDWAAARRLQAPRYFQVFRPLQSAVCVAALLLVQARGA